MSSSLLDIRGVHKRFEIKTGSFSKGQVYALNDVNLSISKGKTMSLVGESGCGKTTLGKAVLGLHKPDDGEIWFQGREIGGLDPRQRRSVQKDLRMIFQDPFSSLNPRKKIGEILTRPLRLYHKLSAEERREKILRTCKAVGIDESYLSRYPHQFSGGQRQRVAIARAIILTPALVVADEPISALDVSIQSQILNLMIDLQNKLGLTYLFITHDISVVKYISDEVAVMYLGEIVEKADKRTLFANPMHPYTKLLFSAVPDISKPHLSEDSLIKGEIPNPTSLPQGCFFAPRCPMRTEECLKSHPVLEEKAPGHLARCFRV
jgi:peptide/nickel transport system ATP-binding protein/oligopeptide transport system ATP-binding protein